MTWEGQTPKTPRRFWKFQVILQRVITLLSWWVVFMGLLIDSWTKIPDFKISLLHIEFEVKNWGNWTQHIRQVMLWYYSTTFAIPSSINVTTLYHTNFVKPHHHHQPYCMIFYSHWISYSNGNLLRKVEDFKSKNWFPQPRFLTQTRIIVIIGGRKGGVVFPLQTSAMFSSFA